MLARIASPAAVVCAALAFAGAASAASDTYAGVSFSPFTIAPGNPACVAWNDDVVGPTGACDPVNVLFPRQTLAAVVARLRAAGWSDAAGSTQWLSLGTAALVPAQAQLAVVDGTDPTRRYHVRLWQAGPGLVVGNVHHEHGQPHAIDAAWDAAEAFLAAGVCASRCGSAPLPVQDALQHGGGSWRGWGNDALATVVPPPRQVATPRRPRKRRARP